MLQVHEREEDMDFLLLLCKKLLHESSRGTKLILMSATISIDAFHDYFSFPIYNSSKFKLIQKDNSIINCLLPILMFRCPRRAGSARNR